ncbi:MAG: RSP_7527 family protein [Steroidobacteraceae bacterium]
MNAYEIEQAEKHVKSGLQLPLSYVAWSEIERQAREERARAVTAMIAKLFAAVSAKIAGASRPVRRVQGKASLNHG